MSDLGRLELLAQSSAQLPVSSYFDQAVFQREMELFFRGSPQWLGHETSIETIGDYKSDIGLDNARILVRTEQGIELVSNVCRHRQAIMLSGQGNVQNIVCPLHRWTYDLSGNLLGAPHFNESPCLNLPRFELQSWRGLLFEGKRNVRKDLEQVNLQSELDFTGYRLGRTKVNPCNYNWKTFIEVYLEDYHVAPFHPGLGGFVTCSDLDWTFGDWFSVQKVGLKEDLSAPQTPVYVNWHNQVRKHIPKEKRKFGAIWLTYFPGFMLEAYPGVLVASRLVPISPNRTNHVVEFYYPEEIALFEPEFMDAQVAAYQETAIEDDLLAERMDQGRRSLYDRGINEVGPYQSPMEDGMQHFHEFYRREFLS